MESKNNVVAMPENSKLNCCSQRNCLLNYFEGSQSAKHPPALHRRTVIQKGDCLFQQGDSFNNVYQVRFGSFKSYIADDNGDWQITGFHFSGDVLGLDGLNSGSHIFAVEALETSSICSLSFHAFEQNLEQGRDRFYRHLLSSLGKTEFSQYRSLMVLGKMYAEQRLAYFLLEISSCMQARGASEMEFNLTMARYDIANYLSMAVETISRLIKRLQEQQLIQVDRNYIRILDMEGLQFMLVGDHRTRASALKKIA